MYAFVDMDMDVCKYIFVCMYVYEYDICNVCRCMNVNNLVTYYNYYISNVCVN